MPDIRSKMTNRLLAALPAAELARIIPSLEHVDLRLGEILHEAGGPQQHFYFPGTCIVSLIGELNNGLQASCPASSRPVVGVTNGATARRGTARFC